MSSSDVIRSWILEALTALGGTGTSLDVSKQVWARQRVEIESTGDLLFTWQLELRTTVAAMAADGELRVDGDQWALSGTARAPRHPTRWDAPEIAVAVEAYLSMIRDRDAGRPLRRAEASQRVRDATGRSQTAIDGLFAHLSAVVQEHGIDYLTAHPPRSNIQAGVRDAVRRALASPASVDPQPHPASDG